MLVAGECKLCQHEEIVVSDTMVVLLEGIIQGSTSYVQRRKILIQVLLGGGLVSKIKGIGVT